MPCYQVNLISVEFKAEHLDLLEKAAISQNLSFRKSGNTVYIGRMEFNTASQTIVGRNQSDINALKRSYSEQVVKTAAKRNGWTVQKKQVGSYVACKY